MKKILTILAFVLPVLVYGQDTLMMKNGVPTPVFNIAPVENPAGLSFFSTYLRRLALDSITSVGFASYGNSVSGPYATSLNTLLRKHFYYYMTTYPSSFNSGLIITQKVVRASYSDSTINQSTSVGTPSNFTYISSGDHVILNNNDSLAGNVGVQTGFDMAKFIFAKTPTSGTAVVTVRDAIADTVVRTQTINLVSSDTVAYGKVDFTGLPEYLRYKFSVRATADSVFLLKVLFMYSKGMTPLQLGRGGSTLAQNNFANRAIMKGLIDDFNIRLIIVSCKEEAPRTSYPALRDSMNKYVGVSKIMIGSLPDSGPVDTQTVYNNIARTTLIPAGWAYIDAYRAYGGYAGLSSIGAQGDGVHPPNSPYDVIIGRISNQAGWNTLSSVYKGNVDNISDITTNYGKFGELYIQAAGNGTLESRKTLVLQSAGGGAVGKINALNLNGVYFGNSSSYAGIGATSSTRVTTLNNAEMQAQAFLVTSSSAQSIFGSVRIQTATAHVAAGAAQFVYRHTDGNIRTRDFSTGIYKLLLEAGTSTDAPLGMTSGPKLTSPTAGKFYFESGVLGFSPSTTWKRFALTNDAAPSNGQLPIGNGTDYTAANITQGYGMVVTNGSGSITIAADTNFVSTKAYRQKGIDSLGSLFSYGRYTPTVSGSLNVASVGTIYSAHYTRIGNEVHVDGVFLFTPTAGTTTTILTVTLPAGYTYSGDYEDAQGTVAVNDASTRGSGFVVGNNTTYVQVVLTSQSTGQNDVHYHFTFTKD